MNNRPFFDYKVPLSTAAGFPARVMGMLGRPDYRYVVAVFNPHTGVEEVHFYSDDGQSSVSDLVMMNKNGDICRLQHIERLEQDYVVVMKTDEVNVRVHPMDSLEKGANPFHHDSFSMGTTLVNGWAVMHPGFIREEDPRGMSWMYLYNSKSGQRFELSFTPELTPEQIRDGWTKS